MTESSPPVGQTGGKCERCGWPLYESTADGCVVGNCSMRPLPLLRTSSAPVAPERSARAERLNVLAALRQAEKHLLVNWQYEGGEAQVLDAIQCAYHLLARAPSAPVAPASDRPAEYDFTQWPVGWIPGGLEGEWPDGGAYMALPHDARVVVTASQLHSLLENAAALLEWDVAPVAPSGDLAQSLRARAENIQTSHAASDADAMRRAADEIERLRVAAPVADAGRHTVSHEADLVLAEWAENIAGDPINRLRHEERDALREIGARLRKGDS